MLDRRHLERASRPLRRDGLHGLPRGRVHGGYLPGPLRCPAHQHLGRLHRHARPHRHRGRPGVLQRRHRAARRDQRRGPQRIRPARLPARHRPAHHLQELRRLPRDQQKLRERRHHRRQLLLQPRGRRVRRLRRERRPARHADHRQERLCEERADPGGQLQRARDQQPAGLCARRGGSRRDHRGRSDDDPERHRQAPERPG